MGGVSLAGLVTPSHTAKCAPDWTRDRQVCSGLCLILGRDDHSCLPLAAKAQPASGPAESRLCSIFSLLELMFLRAPRTHGIALFGSGPDFSRRDKEKRTADKAISFHSKAHCPPASYGGQAGRV